MTIVLLLALWGLFFFALAGELPDLDGVRAWLGAAGLPLVSSTAGFMLGTVVFLSPLAGIPVGALAWRVTVFLAAARRARLRRLAAKQARDFVGAAAGMFAAGKTAAEVLEEAAGQIGEPLGSDLLVCLARTRGAREPLPKLLEELAACWDLSELRGMADIVRFGSDTGGRRAIGRGLVRLGDALRRRDHLLAERARGVAEPALAAWLAVAIGGAGLMVDATAVRGVFAASLAGRVDLALGVGVTVGLVFIVLRLSGRFEEV
ncbi:MAG: hypothetical protein M0Z41_19600 [Peptococcaceae bacterium]|jgi:tight adherence protein B|nr:hypothetical protein [Peptococcaceae bacterium]